ncbi:S1 domain-containing RNA-binding protein [Alicyclobacillus dauci]|uniref:S1 domain-containing RNA-binding protein n=1 Tax=Alicyclobacillus dauci TaxID=1475485 RepID=A0ABY6Z4U0_9BACL|nr:S1 domain-containing RNA-binding protein [Alicyclobacillus dauci]WAH37341.1 S1 domain-containing RNA-binding protein [Alicyclobacillus dauci]
MAIEVGSKLTGKVTGITRFGAFVTLPEGETGLVHISEISDSYVKDVNDFLKVDDEVTVKVISVGADGKIALSIRKAVDTPQGAPGRSHGGDREYGGGRGGHGGGRGHGGHGGGRGEARRGNSFEQLMNRFVKDSEERLSALRRNESKRGGRGGRRG